MQEEWYLFWQKAKDIEEKLPILRREYMQVLREKFPSIPERTQLHHLNNACIAGKYSEEISNEVAILFKKVEHLKQEAKDFRAKSNHLLDEHRKNDTRKVLDPNVDEIPVGEYPKLKNCDKYPKREDCNYGETDLSKWGRCEYMEYDTNNTSWVCTYKE